MTNIKKRIGRHIGRLPLIRGGVSALLAVVVLVMSGCGDKQRDSYHKELYEEVKSTDKMVFATMSITKTAKTERTDWYKIGKRIAVYSYDSYLRAYIDLSALQMEDIMFDDDSRRVKVTLPPVMIEAAGRDMEMKKVYENIGLFRTEIDSRERAEIKELANKSFKKEVESNPVFRRKLTDAAERKARKYIEALFRANGYEASVDFKSL